MQKLQLSVTAACNLCLLFTSLRSGDCLPKLPSENMAPEYEPTVVHKWVTMSYKQPSNMSFHNFRMTYPYDYRNAILGGIKVYKGDIYATIPRISRGAAATLTKIVEEDGETLLDAFPSWEWQEIGNCEVLQTVNNIEIDPKKGWMWIVDSGRIQTFWGGVQNLCKPKLIIYDLDNGEVVARYEFPNNVASITDAFLSDITIDPEAGHAYIPNTVEGKLIFFSLHDNFSIAVDHDMFKYEKGNESITVDGLTANLSPVSAHINGIAMSPRRDYVLFSPLGGYGLYMINTDFFRKVMTNVNYVSELDNHVKRVGYKVGHSRGIVLGHDNVYYGANGLKGVYRWPLTDVLSHPEVTEDMVSHIPQEKVVADDRMFWVDTVTLDNEGVLWISSSNLVRYFIDRMDYHDTYNYFIWKVYIGEDSYLKKKTTALLPLPKEIVPVSSTPVVAAKGATGTASSRFSVIGIALRIVMTSVTLFGK